MKNKKKAVLVLIGIVAVVLVIAGVVLAQRMQNKQKAADAEKAAQEAQETKAVETETPTPTPEMTFASTQENVFIIRDQVDLREEPSTDADVVATVPLNRLLKRTGVGTEWSRLIYEDKECYVVNEDLDLHAVKTEASEAAAEEPDVPEDVPEQETAQANTGKIVIIDPGHQGQGDSTQEPIGPGSSQTKGRVTSGTSGCVSGWDEYELNLAVSLKLRDELVSRGYTVYMTRETHDVNISNKERAAFATEHNGDILVRIHANGSDNGSVSGALTMAPSDSNPFLSAELIAESQRLSQDIINTYISATGFNNQGVYITDEMSGINWTTMPVTIVEMGYMSNASDDAKMADPDMQVNIVKGISNGIDQYFAGH